MVQNILKKFDQNNAKTILYLTILHFAFFNSTAFYNEFQYIDSISALFIKETIKNFIIQIGTLLILFTALSINKTILTAGSLFLFITSSVTSYYISKLGISPSISVIKSAFNTNYAEASELIDISLLCWIAFSAYFCLYSLSHFKPVSKHHIAIRSLQIICILLTIKNITTPFNEPIKRSLPIQYLHNSYKCILSNTQKYKRIDISSKFSFKDNSKGDILGVLIIGESARYDHFGINGYRRNTTPKLAKIDNLTSFKTRSCASITIDSVPCMVSRLGEKDKAVIHKESSIYSALRSLNYHTTWLCTQSIGRGLQRKKQSKGGNFYDDIDYFLPPLNNSYANSLDEILIPHFDIAAQNKKDKKFITLHTLGSHWKYDLRYSSEFAKFKPDTNKNHKMPCDASAEELVNAYDNSILYTDNIISTVINKLKDKKAFIIYSSDHGESLGENSIFSHGREEYIREQREVPLIVWVSDKYKEAYPEKYKNLVQAQQKNVSHDHLYHTILSLLDISSDSIEPSLDLSHQD